MKQKYLGYQPDDYKMAYAKYFNETPCTISAQAAAALQNEPLSANILTYFENINAFAQLNYEAHENGFAFENDGSATVAVLTLMPNVTPAMWHWWFGWHGCADSRYKLWHPQAHLSAKWLDGGNDETYVGRISIIQEYIGGNLEKANIQFVAPETLGLENSEKAVYICARLGYTDYPLDFGWLVHQVRKTANGSEMRSRFFIGGRHIAIRKQGVFWRFASSIVQKIYRLPQQQPKELLQHCSEEMRHLAQFLPELYHAFKP